MSLNILIDSGCDMDRDTIKQYGLSVVPLRTRFGDEEFLDSVTMNTQEFFERLASDPHHPATSQPSPDDFLRAFKHALKENDEVLAITISGKLSGTVQSARLAASDLNTDRIHIVDSENVSLGTWVLTKLACRLRDQGKSAAQIAAILEERKSQVQVLAVLDTLSYLQKGGRISKTVAVAGNLLSIKPIVTLTNGELQLLGKARGAKNSERILTKLINERGGIDFDEPYCLAYSGLDPSPLEEYVDSYRELWEGSVRREDMPVCVIGSTIGTHAGPGAIGVAFFPK